MTRGFAGVLYLAHCVFGNHTPYVLQLTSFLLLSLIKLVTILQLVIVEDGWFYSKEPTKEMYIVLSPYVPFYLFIPFLLFSIFYYFVLFYCWP